MEVTSTVSGGDQGPTRTGWSRSTTAEGLRPGLWEQFRTVAPAEYNQVVRGVSLTPTEGQLGGR